MVKKVVTKTITKTEHVGDEVTKTVEKGEPRVVETNDVEKTIGAKKTSPKDGKKPTKKKLSAGEREEMLIQNFVGLQHAMTNLSIKFGTLSDNIGELLRIFEGAARSFSAGGKVDDSDMLKKIDSLLDQNKTIAKGLVLMEGKLRSRNTEPAGFHGYSAPEPLPPMNQNPGMRQSIAANNQPRLDVGGDGMHPMDQMSPTGNPNPSMDRPKPKPLPEL